MSVSIARNGPPRTITVSSTAGVRLEDGGGNPVSGGYLKLSTTATVGHVIIEVGSAVQVRDGQALGAGGADSNDTTKHGHHEIPVTALPIDWEVRGFGAIAIHGDADLDGNDVQVELR